MLIDDQRPSTSREHAPDAGAPRPEDITPWEMVWLSEDKLPVNAILVIPGEWVMQ